MKWTETSEIGFELAAAHPHVDPLTVRFADLRKWVARLDRFNEDLKRSSDRILQAIQIAWVEECYDNDHRGGNRWLLKLR